MQQPDRITYDEFLKETKEIAHFDYSAVRAYVASSQRGKSEVILTPLGRSEDPQSILSAWKEIIQSKLAGSFNELLEYEIDQMGKAGPTSVMKPLKDRLADVDNYYDLILRDQPDILPHEAIVSVLDEFAGIRGLRLRSMPKVVEQMKLNTNSGLPFFTRRNRVVKQSMRLALRYLEESNPDIGLDVTLLTPAVQGWRGQEGGPNPEDTKQRVVWMYPMHLNILEAMFYQPLIEAVQQRKLIPAWVSMDEVDKRMTQLFDTKNPDDLVVRTDFKKFDQHFGKSLQKTVWTIYDYLATKPAAAMYDWLRVVFPIKFNIPLLSDAANISIGAHGMGSGSTGTNADECFAHRALQYSAALDAGSTLNPNSMVQGDDGVLSYPGITTEQVLDVYTRYGQEMRPEEQSGATDHVIYLSRLHHTKHRVNGIMVGIYPTMRALGRLIYQERYYDPAVWGPKAVTLRYLSILENAKWHPLFNDFVDFVMERDKYKLGVDIPGFLENIKAEAEKITDIMPDFLGYTKSQMGGETGIENWRVVQYLKSFL
jgi:hypothetical protein